MAGPNPPAPFAMNNENNISVFMSVNTGTIVITYRTWEGLKATEHKTFVRTTDADYAYVLEQCKAKGLL